LSAEARHLVVLALLLILFAGAANADVFRSGDLRLQPGGEPDSYQLIARLPESMRGAQVVQWPSGCEQTEARQVALAGRVQLVLGARCSRAPGPGDVIIAPWPLDGARLSIALPGIEASLAITPRAGGLHIPFAEVVEPDRPWTQIAPEMLWQGVLHIWLGWDHLAFVLCLCMLARGWRLLGLVTAFTLGHSLSLGLAFFDVLRLPIAPVEALIALSIVLVAREALLARSAEQQVDSLRRAMITVVLFGLIHGLGFASALGELGIAPGERWPALLSFNLGVELGQVAFVLAVIGLQAALRPARLRLSFRTTSLFAAGICGAFWFFERVAGFGVA